MAAALAPLNDANLRRYAARVPGARPAYRALRRTRRAFSTAWQRLLCHLWLSHNVSATPGMPQARPVFVLFTPRSGSQFLAELMNSVPSVEMRGELLHRHALRRGRWSRIADWAPQMTVSFWRRGAYQSYLTGGLAAPGARVTGCTLSQFQLAGTGLGLDDLVEWFDDARFIILYRRSLAEQCLSWHLSLLTRQWRWTEDSRSNSPFEGRVRLERRAVLNRFELVRQFYSELLEHPELGRRARLLSYEELRDDPQRAFDEVLFPWLGLPHTTVRNERLRKQGTRPMRDVIENYAELEDVLTGPIAEQRYSLPPLAKLG